MYVRSQINFMLVIYYFEYRQRSADYKWFDINDEQTDLLVEAYKYHSDGLLEVDITIQTCLDKDRLELGGIGIKPSPDRLCNNFAKRRVLFEEDYTRSICF